MCLFSEKRILYALLFLSLLCVPVGLAQDDAKTNKADEIANKALEAPTTESEAPAGEALPPEKSDIEELNLWELVVAGGVLMYPIAMMALVVIFFGIERFFALQKSRVVPSEFVQGLGQLAQTPGGLDPRLAYRLCQVHRSPISNVIRAGLLKLGRPHTEVEKAVAEASDKEAQLLYNNVRPIALAMAVTPLMGLLGTVWGMIQTFFVVSQSAGGVKVADLAGGIYVALVTTVAGLSVAIPAAFLAHFYEGRIQRLFRHVDEVVQSIMPQLERYEGKLRVTTDGPAPAAGNASPQSQQTSAPQQQPNAEAVAAGRK